LVRSIESHLTISSREEDVALAGFVEAFNFTKAHTIGAFLAWQSLGLSRKTRNAPLPGV